MLNIGDRFFVEESKRSSEGPECSFRTPPTSIASQGSLIPMGPLVSKRAQKGTVWPRELIMPFARAIEPRYACKINVELRATGFTFIFATVPARGLHHEIEAVCMTRRDVVLVLEEAHPLIEAPPTLVGLFSPSALDVLRWFLDALSGKPHALKVTALEIRWDPPIKPPCYAPLKGHKGKDDEPPTLRNPLPPPPPPRRRS